MTLKQLALTYLVIFLIAPPMASASIFRLIAIVMMMYLVAQNASQSITKSTVSTAIAVAVMIAIQIAVDESITMHIQLYIFMLLVIIMSFLCNERNIRDYYFIIPLLFIVFIIFNIITIRELSIDPHIMRTLSRDSSGARFYQSKGVGGYGYLYALIMIIPAGLPYLKQEKGVLRNIAIVFLVTSYVLIFSSAYLLAMLITITVTSLYIYLSARNKTKNNFLVFCLVMVLIVILYLNLDSLLLWIADLTRPSMIQKKAEDFYEILFNDVEVEETVLYGRYERYIRDFKFILSSPLYGVLRYDLVGKHSAILDIFAQFGIPIGLFVSSAIFKPLHAYAKKSIPEVTASYVGLIVFLVLNSPAMSVGILYILFPLIVQKSYDWNNNQRYK